LSPNSSGSVGVLALLALFIGFSILWWYVCRNDQDSHAGNSNMVFLARFPRRLGRSFNWLNPLLSEMVSLSSLLLGGR
jgi:hypothetical protein